ncbi:MAG: amidohydrolase family protein [Phycisphaerae bacterium]|nr:amidohydrolase family protein [Phycisphaerae bacterium]
MSTGEPARVRAANRFGWDYRDKAAELGAPCVPVIDIHAHVHGVGACRIYDQARTCFGIERTYTMSRVTDAAAVRDTLGPSVRFIAMPNFGDPDRARAHRDGYLPVIETFRRDFDARMLKIWNSPRLRDILPDGATDLSEIDSPWRVKACELGQSLGMMFMVHVADPDTWFSTKYADASRYGTKRAQYEGLERMLDRFAAPWIAAHMGGWPEDIGFLDGLLTRHPNLHLDTSATKWMVRELSRHPAPEMLAFLWKWDGRILFGSDIVTTDDHLQPVKSMGSPMSDLAQSPEEAFDLYASRYWALRWMFEGSGDAPSPIADPDLMMVDPGRYDANSAPNLRGFALPENLRRTLYRGAAERVVFAWEREHP